MCLRTSLKESEKLEDVCVYLSWCKVCVYIKERDRESVCVCVYMVLPTALEMLGCPARLFLDQ